MAGLALFTFDQYNELQVAGAQASSSVPLDFSIGSDTLALIEGATSALLYLQADLVYLLSITRAATSQGADLDTFFADFGFPRLQATYAGGSVTLHRNQAISQITVPADGSAYVLLSDGTQSYQILADAAQPTYDPVGNQYILGVGVTDAAVTALATLPGSGGNVPVLTGLLLGTNTSGLDTATVATGFANGQPAELDPAFRLRFVLFLQSLSRGTIAAIGSAILSVQQGLSYTIANNQDTLGNFDPGNFVVTIDDGSGAPPASLITAVDAAVTAYQGNTISHSVQGPNIVYVSVGLTVTLIFGSDPTQIVPAVMLTIAAYINSLPLGQPLSITRLSAVVYGVSGSINNVSAVTINGAAADIPALPAQIVKLSTGGLTVASTVLTS